MAKFIKRKRWKGETGINYPAIFNYVVIVKHKKIVLHKQGRGEWRVMSDSEAMK